MRAVFYFIIMLTALSVDVSADFSRRVEVFPGTWWLPLSQMQVRQNLTINDKMGARKIAAGTKVEVQQVLKVRALVQILESTDANPFWIRLDYLEPVGSCLKTGRQQFEFLRMHSALIIFVDPHRRSGNVAENDHLIFESGEGIYTHTYNTLIRGLGRYDKDTAAILYYYGASAVCSIAISRDGIIAYSIHEIKKESFEHSVFNYIEKIVPSELLRGPAYKNTKEQNSNNLAKVDVLNYDVNNYIFDGTLINSLKNFANLVIVPHGIISLVPFSTIPISKNERLIDKFAYTIAPSLTWVGIAPGLHTPFRTSNNSPSALVVGNPTYDDPDYYLPNLPGAETEALSVAELLNTSPIIGKNATIAALRKNIEDLRNAGRTLDILHLASHGLADRDPGQWSRSFIALAFGERLDLASLREIGYLGSRLVVLSACQTGIGWVDEVGVVGLQRTFRSMGAHDVVMSLWNIDDAATAEIMREFGSDYKRRWPKSSAATSLREAINKTRKKYPQIEKWGAFSVFGVGPF